MSRSGPMPEGDTIRPGAEWEITDVVFEASESDWKNWETSFCDDILVAEPEEPWVIEEPVYSKEGLPQAEWTIDSTPIFDYPGEESEAMVFIKNPKIDASLPNIYQSANSRTGRIWLNIRRLLQPDYGILPAHRPDPLFAQKMIELREKNKHHEQKTILYDQDLDDRIFPESVEPAPIIAVHVSANTPHETTLETAEHKSWLKRSGEWIKRRRRTLGVGAVALGAVLLFADAALVDAPPKGSNPPAEAAGPRLQPVIISPPANEASDRESENSENESTAATDIVEEEMLRLTIPDGGNLSWTVEYQLVMRGADEDSELAGKVANVVSYLQAQKPDRDLGIVYAGEVIEVAYDQELQRLFAAV